MSDNPSKSTRFSKGRHKDVKPFITQRFVFLRNGHDVSENFQESLMSFRLQRRCHKAFTALMPPDPLAYWIFRDNFIRWMRRDHAAAGTTAALISYQD